MIGGDGGDVVAGAEPFAAIRCDAGFCMVQIFQGDAAEGDNDFGLYQRDFGVQPAGGAKLAFLDRRRAVAGRPAFYDIAGVDAVATDADPGQRLVQQLPGRTDQRHAVFIFHPARSFADQHQRAGRSAVVRGRPDRLVTQRAGGAGKQRRFQIGQAGKPGLAGKLVHNAHLFPPVAKLS